MKYNEAGEYTLVYMATDECGNTTEQIRNVVVESVEPTTERLLFTGGAEDVCAFEGSADITPLTPVFTEPYDGYITAIFTNLQLKVGDGEWVSYPTYEEQSYAGCSSYDDYYVHDTYLENDGYITAWQEHARYIYENSDDVRCAKWDSLEIWTKAGE